MAEAIQFLVTVIITTSSDFRVHRDGGYFVDVRNGERRTGRQMTTRNPATYADALAFVDQVLNAPKHGKPITFDVIDEVAGTSYAGKGLPGYAPDALPE